MLRLKVVTKRPNPYIVRLYSTINKSKDLNHSYADTLSLPKTEFPNRSGKPDVIAKLIKRSSDEIYDWQVRNSLILFINLLTFIGRLIQIPFKKLQFSMTALHMQTPVCIWGML